MTAPSGPVPVQIGSPAAVLAVVPHLLGFIPGNSLVVVGAGQRGRVHLTLRFDLPDPPGETAARDITAHMISVLSRQRLSLIVIIGYGPGHLVTPLADAIRDQAPRAGLELRDVLRVHQGRYWSYLCRDPSCCPAEGVPFNPGSHPIGVALSTPDQSVLPDRDALAAMVAPVTGAAAEAMTKATSRAERIAAALLTRVTESGTTGAPRPLTEAGLKAVKAAISKYRNGGSIEDSGVLAWLALVLTSLRVRDDAWARMDPTHHQAHTRLWTGLVRHAQPGYVAAPASLLAFTAWQAGNGALANVALDRALDDTPGYSMAQLLRDIIDTGADPSMAKLPMTPEEVAASYETQDHSQPAETSDSDQQPAPEPGATNDE